MSVELSDAIHPRHKALVLLAGTGGLRIGELGALSGKRVDFKRGTVEVAENLILDKSSATTSSPRSCSTR